MRGEMEEKERRTRRDEKRDRKEKRHEIYKYFSEKNVVVMILRNIPQPIYPIRFCL